MSTIAVTCGLCFTVKIMHVSKKKLSYFRLTDTIAKFKDAESAVRKNITFLRDSNFSRTGTGISER